MNRLVRYIQDTRAELKHVSWPTVHQSVIYTILVIVISLLVAAFTGVFDHLFTQGIDLIVK